MAWLPKLLWVAVACVLVLVWRWHVIETARHASPADIAIFRDVFGEQGLPVVEEEDSANLDSTRFRDEFVARSRPFVLRNGVKHLWPAFPEAQRGLGTVRREFHSLDAAWRVIRPDTTSMDVETLLDVLQHGKALNRTATRRTLTFAVEQLDVAEYFPGLGSTTPVPTFAEDLSHDVTNVWMCGSGKLSRLHFDAYENLVFQIAGSKTFTIFDPSQLPFLYPTELHEYQTTSSRHNWDKEVLVDLNSTVFNFFSRGPAKP